MRARDFSWSRIEVLRSGSSRNFKAFKLKLFPEIFFRSILIVIVVFDRQITEADEEITSIYATRNLEVSSRSMFCNFHQSPFSRFIFLLSTSFCIRGDELPETLCDASEVIRPLSEWDKHYDLSQERSVPVMVTRVTFTTHIFVCSRRSFASTLDFIQKRFAAEQANT